MTCSYDGGGFSDRRHYAYRYDNPGATYTGLDGGYVSEARMAAKKREASGYRVVHQMCNS